MKSWHSHVDVGKKVLASALSAAMVVAFAPTVAMAEDVVVAKIGNTSYTTLAAAFAAVPTDGTETTITVQNDVAIDNCIEIRDNKNIVLNLNGHEIKHDGYYVFDIANAKFHVTGTGSIFENAVDGYAPIIARGSDTDVENYTVITIDKNVTLKGDYSGIFTAKDAASGYKNYGLVVNMAGTIDLSTIGEEGKDSYGAGIYINGSNNNTTGHIPVYNLDGMTVKPGAGEGIYAAGYASWTISNSTIEGLTGMEIRAGELTLNKGSVLTGTSVPTTVEPNGNGSTSDGCGLAVAQHTTKLPVTVNITGGTINGYSAFYQSNPENNEQESISKVVTTISGGTFNATNGGSLAVYSKNMTGFITNGIFSADPSAGYLAANVKKLHVGTSGYHYGTSESLTSSSYAATCTSAGYSSTYCAECGYVASSSSSPALGHSWGGAVVTTPATETSEGVATSTCGRCGATQTSVLAKLPASGSDTTATDESGSKVDVTVTDNTPTTIPGTTTPAAGTVTYNGTETAEGSVPATSVSIPSTVEIGGSTYVVTAIAEDAFKDETALTNVTIPSTVTSIGESAFAGCSNLETVEVQGEVTSIAPSAFEDCTSLTSINVPETVTTIGESAFAGCTSLTSVSVPAGVATIEANTFANCTSLTTVEVKGELTEIAADAFNGCTNLTSMTVAGTVKPMAVGTLATSGSLVIPESVTKVGDRAFKGTGITSVTIPAGVKMGSSVFRDCKQLKNAVIEKGVKTLSSYTFKGCSALKSVTVPYGVAKIERSVFSGCKNLTKVTLPKTVTSIGKNALYGASKAKTLTVNSKKLTKSGVKGSLAGSKVTTVKVPKSMVSAYKKIFTRANCGKTVKVRAI